MTYQLFTSNSRSLRGPHPDLCTNALKLCCALGTGVIWVAAPHRVSVGRANTGWCFGSRNTQNGVVILYGHTLVLRFRIQANLPRTTGSPIFLYTRAKTQATVWGRRI